MNGHTRADILVDAIKTICEDRQDQYQEPEDNFSSIAVIWSELLKHKLVANITAYDVGLLMAGLKLVRSCCGNIYKLDNIIDLCGYAACAGEIGERENG